MMIFGTVLIVLLVGGFIAFLAMSEGGAKVTTPPKTKDDWTSPYDSKSYSTQPSRPDPWSGPKK